MELSREEAARYNRQTILEDFGQEGQLKLKGSKVLVIGAGGLGSPVLLYLAAAGVGTIGIVDGDEVDASNLHRQVLFAGEDVGQPKAKIAGDKIKHQNPFIQVVIYNEFITTINALQLVGEYDLVIDGSDNFPTRYLVNDACVIRNKPLVFGSIFKFEGQVTVFNYDNGPTYRCLFPEPPEQGAVPNCSEVGVIGVLPGVVGSLMANEAIKLITGVGQVLSGKLLIFRAKTASFEELKFSKNASEIVELKSNYEAFCGVKEQPPSITVIELEAWLNDAGKELQLIDVRESFEREICTLTSVHIPMNEIPGKTELIDKNLPVVVYCHHGMRSQSAINYLKQEGFTNLINLEGGIHAWALQIDSNMAVY